MKNVTIGERQLTEDEKNNIYISLSVRLGFIETGTIHRAVDLQKSDRNFKPKILTSDQMKLIVQTEELMSEFF